MAQLHIPHMPHVPHYSRWETFARKEISVLKLCCLYAVPLSIVPPVMIYYAGMMYGGHLLPVLSSMQLLVIGAVFFVCELAMTFVVASIIPGLAELVDIKPTFEECYKLAVIVPTPLWLAPLFLFVPSFMLNLAVASAAMILSGILIFYCVPVIFRIEEKGHAILLSGSLLSVGMVAWAVMMYLTFLSWSFVTSDLLLMLR